jgi:hypothetical protein
VVLSGEDCHWIVPVLPAKESVVVEPLHIAVADALAVPATEAGVIVIVNTFEFTDEQVPLVTTAR